jgi:hypothetical protein
LEADVTKFIYAMESLSIWVGRSFGWCILILTLSVSYEVFVRYVLNSPTVWAHHLEKADPSKLGRVFILEDAMSPVPAPPLEPLPPSLDFPRVAEEALRDFHKAGLRVVRTTDPIDV